MSDLEDRILVCLDSILDECNLVKDIIARFPSTDSYAGTLDGIMAFRTLCSCEQNIAEASNRLIRYAGESFAEDHPEVPWSSIRGMRNRIVHEYLEFDHNVIINTALYDIPAIVPLFEALKDEFLKLTQTTRKAAFR